MARRAPATSRQARRPARAAQDPQRRQADTAVVPTIRPDVIVDFLVDRGLLFVALHNIGGASAYEVVTRFDRPFHGLGGRKDLSRLALFRSLLFLPPGKQISQLIDHLDAYFQRDEPTRLTATIAYADRNGVRYKEIVPHDLEIYRDRAEPISN
jgi:hypothetical protein